MPVFVRLENPDDFPQHRKHAGLAAAFLFRERPVGLCDAEGNTRLVFGQIADNAHLRHKWRDELQQHVSAPIQGTNCNRAAPGRYFHRRIDKPDIPPRITPRIFERRCEQHPTAGIERRNERLYALRIIGFARFPAHADPAGSGIGYRGHLASLSVGHSVGERAGREKAPKQQKPPVPWRPVSASVCRVKSNEHRVRPPVRPATTRFCECGCRSSSSQQTRSATPPCQAPIVGLQKLISIIRSGHII